MNTGDRLKQQRERSSFTQEQVSDAINVSRELLSLWENNKRQPQTKQLEHLAQIYGVDVDYLLGEKELKDRDERGILYRGIVKDLQVQAEVKLWLDFLDRWADFLDILDVGVPRLKQTPRKLNHGLIEDARRAPTLAAEVREFFSLGTDATPNLYTFLDEIGVLVYRASLGTYKNHGEDQISGAFYNHPKLGYCILVNVDTTLGRQAYTLAHEFAHALYHYAAKGITSIYSDYADPKERFANTFAAHFLVPGKTLRQFAGNEQIDAYKALHLAAYFQVSYATMLMRLVEEKLITFEQRQEWKLYSPQSLANQLGLDTRLFEFKQKAFENLNRYSPSVIELVKLALHDGRLNSSQVSCLLQVSSELVTDRLLSQPFQASALEMSEFDELPW